MTKRYVKLGILMVLVVILDQVTKYMIQTQMFVGQSISLIERFFSITYVQNTGAAWSILEGNMTFFYVITVVALILLTYFLTTMKESYEYISRIGVILMIGGTIGNFIDRIMFSYVRDFLDFIIIGYDFPVFNVADICLCVGIFLIVVDELINEFGVRKRWKKED